MENFVLPHLAVEANTESKNNTSNEPNSSAAGTDSSLDGKEYNPRSFNQEMSKLDELSKTLEECKQRLNDASSRSLLLNVDIVTQFDPNVAAELSRVVEECERCVARVKTEDERSIAKLEEDSTQHENISVEQQQE